MLTTDWEDSSVDESPFLVYGHIGGARSHIYDYDSEFLLTLGQSSLTDGEDIWVDIHDLDTYIEDSLFDIGEYIGSDRYDMCSDFEFFPTHSDWVFDTTLEIEAKALWNYFENGTIHRIEPILAHIECPIDILLSDLDPSNWDDCSTTRDIDVDTRETETHVRELFSSHLLSLTEGCIEIHLEGLHIEDIALADSLRISDSDSEDTEFFAFIPFSDDDFDTVATDIYGYELFS